MDTRLIVLKLVLDEIGVPTLDTSGEKVQDAIRELQECGFHDLWYGFKCYGVKGAIKFSPDLSRDYNELLDKLGCGDTQYSTMELTPYIKDKIQKAVGRKIMNYNFKYDFDMHVFFINRDYVKAKWLVKQGKIESMRLNRSLNNLGTQVDNIVYCILSNDGYRYDRCEEELFVTEEEAKVAMESINSIEEAPRELTYEEVADILMEKVDAMIDYWDTIDSPKTQKERLQGLAFSIFSILDGSSLELPGFIIAPCPHEIDKAYHISEHENWFPENHMLADVIKCDLGGDLHHRVFRNSK